MAHSKMVETRNIKLVAWLRLKGVHPDNVKKLERGRARFGFEMTQEEWQEKQREFDRSEFITYGQCLDAVTDLAY